ncbi:MAG: PAS domain S-box protein [Bacteroidota bacterium]
MLNSILVVFDKATNFKDAANKALDSLCNDIGFDGCSLHFTTELENDIGFITKGKINAGFFLEKYLDKNTVNKFAENQEAFYSDNNIDVLQNETELSKCSYCYIPLIIDNNVFGVLQLAKFTTNIFSPNEIHLIGLIAREFARIIEKHLFEKKILSNEINFKNFLNTTKELMLVMNLEGFIIDANNTTSDRTGYSIEELKKMHVSSLHDEKNKKQAEQVFQKMANKEVAFCEIPIKTKSGAEFHAESYIQEGVWNNETVYYGVIRDMSTVQEYQQSLEDSNSKLFALLDNLPFIAWMKDFEGKYIAVNKPFADAVHLSYEEVIGKKDIDLWYKNNDSIEVDLERKVMDSGIPLMQEREFLFKGIKLWFEININPIYSSGKIIGATGIAKDITERKNSELAIKVSEANLNAIIESSNNSIASFDKDCNLISFNKRYAENAYIMNGIRIKKGMNFTEYTGAQRLNGWKQMFDLALQGQKVQYEKPYIHTDGIRKVYSISVNPIFNNQQVIGFTAFTSDITNIKLKENELIEAKNTAEKASEAKQLFLSTITHEIRTPLNAIIGISNLISTEHISHDLKEKIEMLQFSSNNLFALISDVLDFSKIESGKIEIEKTDFNIIDFFNNLYRSFLIIANEKQLLLNFNIEKSTFKNVNTDHLRISQILINLLGNSIKFTEKGSVSLLAETSFFEGKEGLVLKISDTGIGISEDKINTVFDLFVQADSSIFQRYGGTGLGLTITKKLVELLGGWIKVESKLAIGTTFELFLPIERVDDFKTPIKQALNANTSLNGMIILLVEDNELNQYVAKKFLERWGVIVDIANNGIECLEMIENKKYHLILMDLLMPMMDGYEATSLIRCKAESYFQNIPILALTASAISEVREQALIAGMNDFITKPFNSSELFNKLEKYYNL